MSTNYDPLIVSDRLPADAVVVGGIDIVKHKNWDGGVYVHSALGRWGNAVMRFEYYEDYNRYKEDEQIIRSAAINGIPFKVEAGTMKTYLDAFQTLLTDCQDGFFDKITDEHRTGNLIYALDKSESYLTTTHFCAVYKVSCIGITTPLNPITKTIKIPFASAFPSIARKLGRVARQDKKTFVTALKHLVLSAEKDVSRLENEDA